jgi:tetratricopeptide (TPR) repeat protein
MMMAGKMAMLVAMVGALVFSATCADVIAAEGPALNADVLHLALDWEHIKFQVEDRDLQEKQMAGLAQRAAEIAQRYQGRSEAQIWLGIIISEQASMASENGSPFKALGFAKQARDILEKVEKTDPVTLDAGAPTSLGVLYYRVPGFPVGFGDTAKARQLLQEAIANAPNGLDANYFYGDFLYEQKEYSAAEKVLQHALTLPPHPERPIWDKSRRLVMQELLAKMNKAGH